MLSYAAVLLAGTMVVGQAEPETVLKEYAELMIGGVWKQTSPDGNSVEHTYRWVLNEKFILHRDADRVLSMIGVDPETNQVTWWGFASEGLVGRSVISRKAPGVWNIEGKGYGSGDLKTAFEFELSKFDQDTVRIVGKSLTANGEAQPVTPPATWKRSEE